MCASKLPFCTKLRPHWSHVNSRIPLCIRICDDKFAFVLHVFWQISQLKCVFSLSGKWLLMWAFNRELFWKPLPHVWHKYACSSSSTCVDMCSSSAFWSVWNSQQISQLNYSKKIIIFSLLYKFRDSPEFQIISMQNPHMLNERIVSRENPIAFRAREAQLSAIVMAIKMSSNVQSVGKLLVTFLAMP